MRKPNFFIVGFGRSGSTSVYNYLRQHPDIYMSPVKEPNFFSTDIKFGSKREICASSLDEYLALFKDAGDETIVGEASPLYVASGAAARNIRAFSPAAKILILLRNPVDFLYSWHTHGVHHGYETERDFQRALAAEQARTSRNYVHERGLDITYRYRYVVRRSPHFVKQYFDLFGLDNVHLVVFDRLKSATREVYGEILEFLGVDTDFMPEFLVYNSTKAYSRVRARWLNDWFSKYGDTLTKARQTFFSQPLGLRRFVVGKLTRAKVEWPSLDPALRSELTTEFTPVIKRLEEITRLNLSHWYESAGLSSSEKRPVKVGSLS